MDRARGVIVIVTRRVVIKAAGCVTKTYVPLVDAAGLGMDSGHCLIKLAR